MPLFTALSAAPAFAGRAFLTMWVIALFGRFGADLPVLADGVVESLRALPSWFTGDTALVILGVLALIEIFADKLAEARQALAFIDEYLKPTLSAIIALQLVSPQFGEFISPALGLSSLGAGTMALPLGVGVAVIAAGITWSIASTRNRLLEPISEIDGSGESGIGSLMSWVIDAASALYIVIAILAPVIGFILLGFALIALAMIRWGLNKREKAREVDCPSCGTRHSLAALHCPECSAPHAAKQLTFFGLAVTGQDVTNTESHRFNLLKWRRCPCCAEKLPSRSLQQICPRCKTTTFASQEAADHYLTGIEKCFSRAIVLIGLVGLIPVVGLVFGVIYGRLQVVSGLRIYLGRFAGFGGKLAVTLVSFILLWFQAVPFFGALAVATMVTVSFSYFRSRFRNQMESTFIQ